MDLYACVAEINPIQLESVPEEAAKSVDIGVVMIGFVTSGLGLLVALDLVFLVREFSFTQMLQEMRNFHYRRKT